MNLYTVFSRQFAERPEATALIDARNDRSWSYAELNNTCAQVASRLKAAGLRKGDAVLLFVPMSVALYVSLLACFRLGLVAVIIDPGGGRVYINRCCSLYPPRAFIGTPKAHLLRLLVSSLRAIPNKFSIGMPVPGATRLSLDTTLSESVAVADVEDSAAALVSFTSGSTGSPKAAVRSHGFLLAQHRAISNNHCAAAGTKNLPLFPVFVLSNLASGVTSILVDVDLRRPERIDAAALIHAIGRYQPHSLGAPPVVLSRVIEYCDQHRLNLSQKLTVYSGGAPVFPALLSDFTRIAPNAQLVSVYGSTEAEPIALSAYENNGSGSKASSDRRKGLLAGMPVHEISLRIIRDSAQDVKSKMSTGAFAEICLCSDEIGEIVVSGEHVLQTYLNGNGDAENKIQVDGRIWHRTGDAGSLDSDGRLWLAGRCQARLEDDRGISYPLGIEAVAQEVGNVERAALVTLQGDRVLLVACKQVCQNMVEQEIRPRLVGAGIDVLRFMSSLPVDRRHNGKIDYARLYKLLG